MIYFKKEIGHNKIDYIILMVKPRLFQEVEPRQKQHTPKSKSQQKPRNHQYHNHQQQQAFNPQMQQQKFLEMSYSYNLSCLMEENSLSAGSFVRKFMDDDGFIKCEIFARIFQFVFFLFSFVFDYFFIFKTYQRIYTFNNKLLF